jgi:hypothetical protein
MDVDKTIIIVEKLVDRIGHAQQVINDLKYEAENINTAENIDDFTTSCYVEDDLNDALALIKELRGG